MAPPKYADLNLPARSLLNKGFNYGHYKVDFGLDKFCRGFVQYNSESKSSRASFTTLHRWPEYGLKFKNHVSTEFEGRSDVSIVTQMRIKDHFSHGLKLSFETSFIPSIGKKEGLMMVTKRTDDDRTSATINFDFAGTLVSFSHVRRIMESDWHIGARYNSSTTPLLVPQSLLHPLSFTLAYLTHPLSMSLSVSNQTEFQLTTHKRVSDDLKLAAVCDWSTLTSQGRVVVGGRYNSAYGTFRLKGNSLCQLSASYQIDLINNLNVLLSAQLECDRSSPIGHKVGLGVKLKL